MDNQTLDLMRRWANLILAISQIAVTVACFSTGTSFDDSVARKVPDPPIVPAGYAFIVWSVIYAGSLAYGIYQFSNARAADPLLRGIGWWTASAFLACCCWLLCVRSGHVTWTLPCMLWLAVSLTVPFRALWGLGEADLALRWCVAIPLSIYAGWISVAVFANTASVAKAYAWRPAWLGQTSGSLALMLLATILAIMLLRESGWNLAYGATITWALIAIGVRNQFELKIVPVAVTAWAAAALLVLLVLVGRLGGRIGQGGSALPPFLRGD